MEKTAAAAKGVERKTIPFDIYSHLEVTQSTEKRILRGMRKIADVDMEQSFKTEWQGEWERIWMGKMGITMGHLSPGGITTSCNSPI